MSELARIERVVILQSVDLFAYCRAEEILRISAITDERSVGAGEAVYELDEPAHELYCVVRGQVVVTEGGVVRRLGPLHAFGVRELLSGRRRQAVARAESDVLLLAIRSDDFFDLLANNVEIVRALFRQLLRRDGSGEEAR